jgi:hypothetical protein
VYFGRSYDVTSTAGIERIVNATRFATLGYRWNYEQNLIGNNSTNPNGASGFLETVNKWYNPNTYILVKASTCLQQSELSANLVTVSDVVLYTMDKMQ